MTDDARSTTNDPRPMKHTFVIYVEDKPGVLNRVASLFRRRAFNIESLTVGHTEKPGVSRMTVLVESDAHGARRVEANLYKLVNVLRVTTSPLRRLSIASWRWSRSRPARPTPAAT